MICIAALIVFGILGIFSASKRVIAKEALDCVFRRLTLRKCTTGLDKRLKAQLTGKVMKKHPTTAKFLYKNFEWFSWAFIILFVASLVGMGVGAYNYYEYGNCNGPDSESFCLFDPLGAHVQTCTIDGAPATNFSAPPLNPGVGLGNPQAPVTLIEFGCYGCPNTQKAQDTVNEVLGMYEEEVFFVFKTVPLKSHENSDLAALTGYCGAKLDPDLYWGLHNALMANEDRSPEALQKIGLDAGYDETLWECVENRTYWDEIDVQIEQALASGVYGTPTFFIGEEVLVGPRPARAFRNLIDDALAQN